jgi:hypothetical protein
VICAHGGKVFKLYYVRFHHPCQTEGGLMRRNSLDRGGPQTFVFWRHLPGGQYGMAEEFTEKLIEKVRKYVFLYNKGHPEFKNLVKKAEAWRDTSEELHQTVSLCYLHTSIYKYWYIIY